VDCKQSAWLLIELQFQILLIFGRFLFLVNVKKYMAFCSEDSALEAASLPHSQFLVLNAYVGFYSDHSLGIILRRWLYASFGVCVALQLPRSDTAISPVTGLNIL